MVKLRLVRIGAKKRPFYRIIAIDEREKRSGRPLEFLGTYDPNTKDAEVKLETAAVDVWLAKGAQMSPTVKSLVARVRREAAASAGGA
ncbi:MAG: 30S ribosomal protein S16 [bacterium]|nr:30S ribosomal protein S16 [bacterium]